MYRSWDISIVVIVVCLSALTGASAAQSGNDLPSAPSAVIQQEKAPPVPIPQAKPAAPASGEATSPNPDTQPRNDEKASVSPGPAEKPETPDEGRPTYRRQVNEVSVVFTVTDKHNRYVKDLKEGDFKIVDDQKPIERMSSFRRESD